MILTRIFVILVSIASAWGSICSIQLAHASWLFNKRTESSVLAATHREPFNSLYLVQLAQWQPNNKRNLLNAALALNPFDSPTWIDLGLLEEFTLHDVTAAEKAFLNAAKFDHMYLPRFTLANFYFRHGNVDRFATWAKDTLTVTPYVGGPLFYQLWSTTLSPTEIATMIPDRPRILYEYVSFLVDHGQLPYAVSTARKALLMSQSPNSKEYAGPTEGRRFVLGYLLDELLLNQHLQEADAVWNQMRQSKWIPFPTPTTANPITNGDFRRPITGHGFDWKSSTINGVTPEQFADLGRIRITLSGLQPEATVLLSQSVPLASNQRYTLKWHFDQNGLRPGDGLAWHLYAHSPTSTNTITELASADMTLSSQQIGNWTFETPLNASNVFSLNLEYRRPLGMTRAQGELSINNVELQLADSALSTSPAKQDEIVQ